MFTYLIKEASLELACHLCAVAMHEFTLSVHLTISEGPFVLMSRRPLEDTLTINQIAREFAHVAAAIGKDS